MILLSVANDSPKITDWITAGAAAIGIPFSLWAFIKLIIRDKARETQISSLTSISKQLFEQVKHLAAQTAEFQYQSNLMLDHNKLLEKQIELQADSFLNANALEEKKIAMNSQKRLIEIKPHFIYCRDGKNGYIFEIELRNKGFQAQNITVTLAESDNFYNATINKSNVDHDGLLTIYIEMKVIQFDKQLHFKIILNYEDVDNNRYRQFYELKNSGNNVSSPELIK